MTNKNLKSEIAARQRAERYAVILAEYERVQSANPTASESRCITLTSAQTGYSTAYIYQALHN